MPFLETRELDQIGFAHVGKNVRISSLAVFYNPGKIRIGDNSRIDDFCVLSAGEGGIEIGRFVHVAVFSSLMGAAAIRLEDFSGLSSRVSIYSSSDDYSGKSLTNPTIPARYKKVKEAPVTLERHVIVGAGAVILPGVTLRTGSALGALSMATKSTPAFTVCTGVPAKPVMKRSMDLLEIEKRFLQDTEQTL